MTKGMVNKLDDSVDNDLNDCERSASVTAIVRFVSFKDQRVCRKQRKKGLPLENTLRGVKSYLILSFCCRYFGLGTPS